MDHKISHVNLWNVSEAQETLQQVADLCVQTFGLPVKLAPDGASFASVREEKSPSQGLLAYRGKLVENDFIILECELFQGPPDLRVSSKVLFEHPAAVGEKVRPAMPKPG